MAKQFDAGNPTDVKEKKSKAQLRIDRETEELREILTTYGGRAYIWRVLEKCGIYRTSFTGNSTTFFNEGKRSIGLEIIEELFNAHVSAYNAMQSEAVVRKEEMKNE